MKGMSKSSSQEQKSKIMVPPGFWPEQIERCAVPQNQIKTLVQESGIKPTTPLSLQSKLSSQGFGPIYMEPEVTLSESERSFCSIFNAGRQHRLHPTSKLWVPPRSHRSKREKTQKYAETAEPSDTTGNCYVVWQLQTMSCAKSQMKKAKCQLAAHDVMLLAICNYWFDDLEIRIESEVLHVDRFLFSHFAKNFRDCRDCDLQIPLENVDMCLLRKIYDWMLGNEQGIRINRQLIPFFQAAKFLGIDELLDQFWAVFSRNPVGGVWEQNAIDTYLSARTHHCEQMMIMMLSRVRKGFLPWVASREFLELDAQQLVFLLRLKTICVNGEEEVFFACLLWLEHAWQERQQYVSQLMSNMHFCLLPAWLLRTVETQCENQMLAEVFKSPDFQDWLFEQIRDALSISVSMESARYATIFKTPNIGELERSWVYCGDVPHHHDSQCPNYRQLSYRTFKLFLQRLQQQPDTYMKSLKCIQNRAWHSFRCCRDVLKTSKQSLPR
ncbi:uncharacterized protein LOC111072251 [Drosophila obscura]|uniref:uncharacterized protein LOC111072251 n=1 Tax=Drosophila obscura TaxID=7282 RepID=UPI001BB10E2A|nr:uncharacterized protein LOC111072251 [Drosophila obscura]